LLPPRAAMAERAPAIGDLFCAGFIEHEAQPLHLEVIGSEQEQEQRHHADGDLVFVNAGSAQGMQEGREFAVVRPRGRFKSPHSSKDGSLGVFTQVVGRVRLVEVKQNVSVALVTGSCEAILLGDVLRNITPLQTPPDRSALPLERFADPSGKATGRIVMARDLREMISLNQVAYIDLGREDNLKPGDLLTIYRPLGKGSVTDLDLDEITENTRSGYESRRWRGGKFSNKANRATNPHGTDPEDNEPIRSPEVKKRRPEMPRKVVGEVIVLRVEQRTATVLVTRVAQEVHTGDRVELQ
ncbi:MAG TPA: hypothetical protein VGV38_08960, partial [Pyrinomonadaceae bacterium]|nr:hypothetical protein [Pyrinomonadaceae bacterium]